MKKNHLKIGVVFTFVLLFGFGCSFDFSIGKPKQPTNDEVEKLVRTTTTDFTESLEKDDFEIIRKKGSARLQEKYSARQVKESVNYLVEDKDRVLPVFRDAENMQIVFSKTPVITEKEKGYFLNAEGSFLAQNRNIEFRIVYLREGGRWKIYQLWFNPYKSGTK